MKTASEILAVAFLLLNALLISSCGTFIKSNVVDEATLIKGWLKDLGYIEKSNGFFLMKSPNSDNTSTITKNYLFGNFDDAIVKDRVLAYRIKPVDKYQQYECIVEQSGDYYYIQNWKSFYYEDYDSTRKMVVPSWKIPYKATFYIKKDQISQDNFTDKVKTVESDFVMNYTQFLEHYNNMLKEYEDEIKKTQEQNSADKEKINNESK